MELLTVNEVAEMAGVHHNTVRNEYKYGKLVANPTSKKVRVILFDMDEVLRWMDERVRDHKVAY